MDVYLLVRKFFYSKQGVSPLLATILLVFLALIIGKLSADFITEIPIQPFICEQQMKLAIVKVADEKKICVNNKTYSINYVLQNQGVVIDGFYVMVTGNTSDVIDRSNITLQPNDSFIDTIDFDPNIGEVRRLEFKPVLLHPALGEVDCQRSILIEHFPPPCP